MTSTHRRSRSFSIRLGLGLIAVLSLATVALLAYARPVAVPDAARSSSEVARDDTSVIATPDTNLEQARDSSSGEEPASVTRARDQLASLVRADSVGLTAETVRLFAADAVLLPSTPDDFTEATFATAPGLVVQVPPELDQPARSNQMRDGQFGGMSLGGAGGGGGSIAGGAGGLVTDPGSVDFLAVSSDLSAGSLDATLEAGLAARALGLYAGGSHSNAGAQASDGRSIGHDQRGPASGSYGNSDTHGRSGDAPGASRGAGFAPGSSNIASVPEPSILLLMGVGLSGLTMLRRRRVER